MLLLPRGKDSYLWLAQQPLESKLYVHGEPRRRRWSAECTWTQRSGHLKGNLYFESSWLSVLLDRLVLFEQTVLLQQDRPVPRLDGDHRRQLHFFYDPALWRSVNSTLKRYCRQAGYIAFMRP